MRIESDRLKGLSAEQRERFLEVMHAIGERTIDTIQRGDCKLYLIAVRDGLVTSAIGYDWDAEPQRFESLTEWSEDAVQHLRDSPAYKRGKDG